MLRLPFLNQAVQGDDYYYLAGAMHAQVDPLHPTHFHYVFSGQKVDVRGHPHPPLNMWMLAGLLALFGDVYEIPFHAAYILFSLIAALAMWRLASRFSPAPLWATLLFLATPAFVVNGNSLESDVPFLAFWLASVALFVTAADRRSFSWLAAAAVALTLASLAAYQAVVLIPILGCYLLLHRRTWWPGWAVLAAPAAVLAAWQLFERLTGGVLPAGVLAGYFKSYGLQAAANKLDNAVALTVHAGWLVFPLLALAAFRRVPRWVWAVVLAAAGAGAVWLDASPLFWASYGIGLLVVLWCLAALKRWDDKDSFFLAAWVVLFFAAALALFFAGSARYLLPIAAPVALLVTRQLQERRAWLAAGFALALLLGLSLSLVNYQHWDAYRRFVASLGDQFQQRRVWVNAEWGLRFYAEAAGGLPLERSRPVQPGDAVLTSRVCFPISFSTGGGRLAPFASRRVTPWLPFRIIGLGARSAYSTVTQGYRPFDIVRGPLDEVTAQMVIAQPPVLSYLPMNAPEAEHQIVSGIYQLESGAWRWMGRRAVVLLKAPAEPLPVQASLYIPEQTPAREVTVTVDGITVAAERFPSPGSYTLISKAPVTVKGESATVSISVDRVFSPPGDTRRLGVILTGIGFRKQAR